MWYYKLKALQGRQNSFLQRVYVKLYLNIMCTNPLMGNGHAIHAQLETHRVSYTFNYFLYFLKSCKYLLLISCSYPLLCMPLHTQQPLDHCNFPIAG